MAGNPEQETSPRPEEWQPLLIFLLGAAICIGSMHAGSEASPVYSPGGEYSVLPGTEMKPPQKTAEQPRQRAGRGEDVIFPRFL